MRLSKTEQRRMRNEILDAYAFDYLKMLDGWRAFSSFDRHSPCDNILFVLENTEEIKVYLPNSTKGDPESEQYNTINVWVNDEDTCEEFYNIDELMDYLVDLNAKFKNI